MKLSDVKGNAYIDSNKDVNAKILNFKMVVVLEY